VSDDFFARERERIFYREWFCVGREEELPHRGDYLHVDVAGESILLVRCKSGSGEASLAAFYNVCRHRGSRLVPATDPGTGCFRNAIRCPYHSWTYNLDGKLRTAPFLEAASTPEISGIALHGVAVACWGGFIFVRLEPLDVPRLAEQLDAIPHRLERYELEDLRAASRISYDVAANWKAILENYNECYHCGPVHPELCSLVPAFKQHGGSELDWDRGIPHRPGAYTFTATGTTARQPFPGLNEDERTRHKGELIYPNLMLSLAADHVAAFTLWPRGPAATTVQCDFLFHPAEMEKSGFDPSDAVDFWDLVNRQDWRICESVQRGMSSRVFEFGYYAPMEDLSLDIRRYVAERIEGI
jgi:Rieske 2Fe-2S family protein